MPGAEQAHSLIRSAGLAGASAVCQALLQGTEQSRRGLLEPTFHRRKRKVNKEIENLVSC